MEESLKEKIERLKREYQIAEQAQNFRVLIAEKRDELEEKIQALKQQMEQETFKLYRNKDRAEKEQRAFTEKMLINAKILRGVEKTKQELDTKLDEYELFSREVTVNLRNELILAILEQNPSKVREYDNFSQKSQEQLQLQNTLNSLARALSRIDERLSEIIKERKSVKKLNVLRYLFGKNPNVSITNSLIGIERSIDEILSWRDLTLMQASGSPEWLLQCFDRCVELKELAKRRWGWKRLDHEVIPYKRVIEEYETKLMEYQVLLENDIKNLRQEMNKWIDTNS